MGNEGRWFGDMFKGGVDLVNMFCRGLNILSLTLISVRKLLDGECDMLGCLGCVLG